MPISKQAPIRPPLRTVTVAKPPFPGVQPPLEKGVPRPVRTVNPRPSPMTTAPVQPNPSTAAQRYKQNILNLAKLRLAKKINSLGKIQAPPQVIRLPRQR